MDQKPGETREQQPQTAALLAELQDALDVLHSIRVQIAEREQERANALGPTY
jgi:hypothetical protein